MRPVTASTMLHCTRCAQASLCVTDQNSDTGAEPEMTESSQSVSQSVIPAGRHGGGCYQPIHHGMADGFTLVFIRSN